MNNYEIDIEDTNAYLKALGVLSEINWFQTFDDCQEPGHEKRTELTKVFHAVFDQVADKLVELNKKGAGIFIQISRSDNKGRKKENIKECNVVFADKDDGDFNEFPIAPALVVNSGNGQHAYWVLDESVSKEEFTHLQKNIIKTLGTDKSIHNPDRVMRLPGFYHLKDPNNPKLTKIVESNPVSYKVAEIEKAFSSSDSPVTNISNEPALNKNVITQFWNWVDTLPAYEGERNSTVTRFVRQGLAVGLQYSELENVIERYCKKSNLPTAEAKEVMRRHVEEHKKNAFRDFRAAPSKSLKVLSLKDLVESNIPPTDWIVDQYLARCSTSIIAADPKAGKSTLIRHAALAIAYGIDFVGRKTTQGKVLYLGFEELEYEVQQHFKKMLEALSLEQNENLLLVFESQGGDILQSLEQTIVQHVPDFVIIDPLVFCAMIDLNKYSDVYPLIQRINNLAKIYNCHIVTIHHSRKGDGDGFEKILGSVALPAAFFSITVLANDPEGYKYIESKQKSGEWIKKTKIEFNKDTGLFSFSEVDATPVKMKTDTERVLEVIPPLPDSITESEIWRKVSLKTVKRNKVLSALLQSGLVLRVGKGAKGDPFKYSLSGNKEEGNSISTSYFPLPQGPQVNIQDDSDNNGGEW